LVRAAWLGGARHPLRKPVRLSRFVEMQDTADLNDATSATFSNSAELSGARIFTIRRQ
jgi:hypothetical protein